MLQLQTKDIDICRISKLLVKFRIKASITDSVITLDGDISDELLTQLCDSININAVQNFISQEPLYVPKETSSIKSDKRIQTEVFEEPKKVEASMAESEKISATIITEPEEAESTLIAEPEKVEATPTTLSHHPTEYDLIYSEAKRGEAYWCDLGDYYGHIQGGMRPIIVISANSSIGNNTIIVIPCSTQIIKEHHDTYHFYFSSETMLDYKDEVTNKLTCALASQITTVNKFQLRGFIGTMTSEFMEKMQDIIDNSLNLSREVKTIVKQEKVYVDRPVPKKAKANPNAPKERKDVNMVQVQLLSLVDINELFRISQSSSTDEVKAQKILELFGFDFEKNGVQYLLKAIILSPKDTYFDLKTLSNYVSRRESIDKEEIERLIVARVKENFGFRNSPTIDFIRLVNNFLVKQEINYEKTNI